jgi:signal transduction histidine kinase
MRDGFAMVRKSVGENTYLINNDLKPNRAAIGMVDAHRGGAESKRHDLRPTIDDLLRCYFLQGAWGAVDPDAYYLGTDVENISSIHGGWPLVRTWASMVGLSCGAAITSDPWYWEGFKPLLRNVETMTPPASERTEVMDLGVSGEFPRLIGHVTRDWGDMTVALLWNPGTTERTVTLDFHEAGMLPDRRYAVWSFWDDRFLGVAKGSWTTPSLPPTASQHLRFTDLDRSPDRPVLIGSNLHIYCGAKEIQRVTSLQGAMEIELTDAGARDGDMFVYSRLTPVLKSASGCKVDKIAYAGENVWRLAVTDRRIGVPQRVEMSIQLPVWKQTWFWLLVAVAAASVLFSAWRYLAILRLERQHALQQERSRIAQDLHDNIGANLAQIGLLTEQVEQAMDDPAEMRAQLDRIFNVSHATAKELDAVVWAVDPANDTVEEFARYIHGYAEDYLGMAGIRCHFTSTGSLPELHLSASLRHHLLMVVKEALHNVVGHAAATVVTLNIGMEDHHILLEIADDGRGLPPADAMRPGNGLQNMHARAAEMGGTCEFLKPESGTGTIVRLKVPIRQ